VSPSALGAGASLVQEEAASTGRGLELAVSPSALVAAASLVQEEAASTGRGPEQAVYEEVVVVVISWLPWGGEASPPFWTSSLLPPGLLDRCLGWRH
jgi:hypothetical protein